MKAFDTIIKILKERNQDKRLIKTLTIGFGASIVVILLSFTWLVRQYELKALDLQFRIREWYKPMKVSDDIVLVKIDDETVKRLGWPLPRDQYALFIKGLENCKPKALVFDILLADPGREEYSQEDDLLAYMTEKAGNVYHAAVFSTHSDYSSPASEELLDRFALPSSQNASAESLSVNSVITPIPSILEVSKGIGNIEAKSDDDGVLRRVPMIVKYHGRFYPSLSLAAVLEFLSVDKVSISPGKEVKLLSDKFSETSIPIDKNGRMLVNYSGKEDTFLSYSFLGLAQSLLEPEASENIGKKLRDKIVLIGSATTGDVDSKPTPFSSSSPTLDVHANIINDILQKDFLSQASALTGPILIIVFGLLMSAIVVIPSRPTWSTISFVGLLFICVSASFLSFAYFNQWVPLIQPTLSVVICFVVITSYCYISEKSEMLASLKEASKLKDMIVRKDEEMKISLIMLDELKERMGKMGDAAGVAHIIRHEIVQPLSSIQFSLNDMMNEKKEVSRENLQMMLEYTKSIKETATKIWKEKLDPIIEQSGRGEDIIRAALRHWLEGIQDNREKKDINKIVRNVLFSVKAECKQKKIKQVEEQFYKPLEVSVDEGRIYEVMLNIIRNAIESMPNGGTLTLTTQLTGRFVQIKVSDTGDGILDEYLNKIFEPYFTTKSNGSGLGLPIARAIVEAHNGSIQAENISTGGALFSIRLPIS